MPMPLCGKGNWLSNLAGCHSLLRCCLAVLLEYVFDRVVLNLHVNFLMDMSIFSSKFDMWNGILFVDNSAFPEPLFFITQN